MITAGVKSGRLRAIPSRRLVASFRRRRPTSATSDSIDRAGCADRRSISCLIFVRRSAVDRWPRWCRPAGGRRRFPFAWLTLAATMAVRRSSRLRPSDESTAGLTCMRTPGFCPPLMLTMPDARQLRNLLRQPRLGQVFHFGQRQRVRSQRQRQNRRVGRIGLVVDRRVGQVRGRKVEAALIAACTCCSATSISSVEDRTAEMMTEHPSELVDVIWSSPAPGRTAAPEAR